MYRARLAAVMLVLVVAACGSDTESGDSGDDTGNPPVATPTDEPSDPESMAIADLAAHAGVDPGEVEVVANEQVTWRDGSIGCPEPGESYTQALVEGYRILLQAGGVEYAYHGATGEPPFRCDDPDPNGAIDPSDAAGESGEEASPPSDPPKEDTMPKREGPVAEAIADLAAQTGAERGDIEVVTHQQVTWRDGSMGCPKPGMMYTQALVDGYRIVLRVNDQEVAYHGANGKAPFRCDNPGSGGALDGR